MPTYPPGSFTKNFGWNLRPPSLNRLYETIRAGFKGVATSVTRDQFRRDSSLADPNVQLIPVNFFLHNTVVGGVNHVTVDELVRHAINNPHSRRFDWLALFSLHLSRMGRRLGAPSGGAAFANDFVRNHLWRNGGWEAAQLDERVVESAFNATIAATGADTVHKCVTNYRFILEMAGVLGQRTKFTNTHPDEWVGPALFLVFDRYSIDRSVTGALTKAKLLATVRAAEFHKLAGTTEAYVDEISSVLADEYLELNGIDRVSGPALLAASGNPVLSSPAAPPQRGSTTARSRRSAPQPTWSDEDAENAAAVIRRMLEVQAQIRNPLHVRELKALYQNACVLCGKQTVVGVNPSKHYSEAAHVKPVGQPHNGPDRKDNMVILCPEHHLQFDRGVLRIRKQSAVFIVVSRIPRDPLNGATVNFRSPHHVRDEYVTYHYDLWR